MASGAKGRYHVRYRVIALDPGAVRKNAVIIVQPALDEAALNDITRCLRVQETQRDYGYSLIQVFTTGVSLQKLRDEIDAALNPPQPVVFCVEVPGVITDAIDERYAMEAPAQAKLYVGADSPEQAVDIARQALSGAAQSVTLDWGAATVTEYVRQHG